MLGTATEVDGFGTLADLVAERLRDSGEDAFRVLFNSAGFAAPRVTWSPGRHELRHPAQGRFAAICDRMRDATGHVTERNFDLGKFGSLVDRMMVLVPDGAHYRYVHYGREIARHYGRDPTGGSTADFPAHITRFFDLVYQAASERREWVLTEHEPPTPVFVRLWRRLIVPVMVVSGERVVRFVALNLAENELRSGLELLPDPVFVTDGERAVLFANSAARKEFGLPDLHLSGPRLGELAGLMPERLPPTEEMLARQLVERCRVVRERAGMHDFYEVSVSAAEHRCGALYVVVLRREEA